MSKSSDVQWCRNQFPALATEVAGQPAVFFDGPAGSQVPRRVIDAVADYFTQCNANHGGLFQTSRQSDAILAAARHALADFLGTCCGHGETCWSRCPPTRSGRHRIRSLTAG